MIRIIEGIYKGRYLKIPDSNTTRPTMDKVRQAIFNVLKGKIEGRVCLDLFSGSGAMGIEALSRGASKVYFNDKDYKTFNLIKDNIKSINISYDDVVLSNLDYRLFIKKYKDVKFDIVFLDPPYKFKINSEIIKQLNEMDMLSSTCVIVSEQDDKNIQIDGFNLKEYIYGNKKVGIYSKV